MEYASAIWKSKWQITIIITFVYTGALIPFLQAAENSGYLSSVERGCIATPVKCSHIATKVSLLWLYFQLRSMKNLDTCKVGQCWHRKYAKIHGSSPGSIKRISEH